jgi:hypothetical protein
MRNVESLDLRLAANPIPAAPPPAITTSYTVASIFFEAILPPLIYLIEVNKIA